MKRILFIVALLPFIVKAQSINNQKVRWMQPIYMGSNTAATVNTSSDTGAFFFDRADSVLYFKYKGSARALGYAGSIPNVGQQITDSLRALVRLRASGSGGIDLQNSSGTSVANFGSGGSTNISLNGSTNINARLTVTDSIVGVNQRLTGSIYIGNNQYLYGRNVGNTAWGSLIGINTSNKVQLDVAGLGSEFGAGSNFAGIVNVNASNGDDWFRISAGGQSFGGYRITAGASSRQWAFRGGNSSMSLTDVTASTDRLTITDAGVASINGSLSVSGALTATAQGNNIAIGVDSSVTSTSYTLVLGDAGYLKRCSNASAITITVPTNASVAFPIGTTIYFSQQGAGKVSVSPATSDVTIQSEGSLLGTAGQHAVIGLVKVNTNRWLLVGNRG